MKEKNKEVEIDLLELARKLWDNKKFIIKATLIGVVVGLVVAFSIPKEYTTKVIFTTSSSVSSTGNIGTLASLAGFNIGNMQPSEILSPELYSDILNSTPFVKGLLNINVIDSNKGVDTTLYCYLRDKQKTAWWSFVLNIPSAFIGVFKSGDNEDALMSEARQYFISKEEIEIIEKLKQSYSISTDKKTGVTTLEVTSQSPIITAFMADTITSYLQSYIIKERTKKAKTDLINAEKLHTQSKKEYFEAQQNLAFFIDANKNVISARYKINQEKLQNEANLAYTVYNQTAQQVQINKIKVQDDTPVFTIIQPAIEPIFPSTPSKKIILAVFLFFSILLSSSVVLKKEIINLLKSEPRDEDRF